MLSLLPEIKYLLAELSISGRPHSIDLPELFITFTHNTSTIVNLNTQIVSRSKARRGASARRAIGK